MRDRIQHSRQLVYYTLYTTAMFKLMIAVLEQDDYALFHILNAQSCSQDPILSVLQTFLRLGTQCYKCNIDSWRNSLWNNLTTCHQSSRICLTRTSLCVKDSIWKNRSCPIRGLSSTDWISQMDWHNGLSLGAWCRSLYRPTNALMRCTMY